MNIKDMIDLRDKIEGALKTIGWKFDGAGVSMVESETDLQGTLDGNDLDITIRLRD